MRSAVFWRDYMRGKRPAKEAPSRFHSSRRRLAYWAIICRHSGSAAFSLRNAVGPRVALPYQAFEAADGPIMIGVANDKLWRKFCAVAGLEAIVDDPRFRTNADRVAHRKETVGHVQSAVAQHSVAYWNDVLAGAGVPCAPINSIAQLLDHPHTRASGMIVEYEHQMAGRLKGVGHPVLIDGAERGTGLATAVAWPAHRRCPRRDRSINGNNCGIAAGARDRLKYMSRCER